MGKKRVKIIFMKEKLHMDLNGNMIFQMKIFMKMKSGKIYLAI